MIHEITERQDYTCLKDFFKKTYRPGNFQGNTGHSRLKLRPRIVCKDGFSMSVQASGSHYCLPRKDLPDGEYGACEIGAISRREELLEDYAEDPRKPLRTVYVYVPVELADEIIRKHGGFVSEAAR